MHLSEFMAANNFDDDHVAGEIKRSRVTVSRIRRRKLRPDWETIKRIRVFTSGQVTADDFENIEITADEDEDEAAA